MPAFALIASLETRAKEEAAARESAEAQRHHLEKELALNRTEVEELKGRLQSLETETKKLAEQNEDMKDVNDALTQDLDAHEERLCARTGPDLTSHNSKTTTYRESTGHKYNHRVAVTTWVSTTRRPVCRSPHLGVDVPEG